MSSSEREASARPAHAPEGVTLDVLRYDPGAREPPYEYEVFNLCLVLSGGCVERRGGATHRYVGPAVTVNVPSTRQAFEIGPDGARCLSIDVQDQWLRSLEEGSQDVRLQERLEPAVNVRDPARVAAAVRLMGALEDRHGAAKLVVEERLIDALSGLGAAGATPASGEPPAWLSRVRERLSDNPSENPTLGDLAEGVGVHRVHLARTFKRYFGRSVGEELRHVRLRRAIEEIANTSHPLGRIALRAGFYDQSHFNRHFTRMARLTPGRFRQLVRAS